MSDDPNDISASVEPGAPAGPLPNRLTRGTLLGCLGIACVLALPGLLFLPVEDWHVPRWLALLVPLAAFGALALGAWLLARMPPGRLPTARNVLYPVTEAGLPPLVERPATVGNRAGAAATLALALVGIAAFALLGAEVTRRDAAAVGLLLMGGVGVALSGYGLLALAGRMPPPAWRWVRAPIRGAGGRAGIPLALGGLAALTWTLVIALEMGYRWAAAGLALVVLGGVLAAPLARRAPRGEP